jgi:hypothetical protein
MIVFPFARMTAVSARSGARARNQIVFPCSMLLRLKQADYRGPFKMLFSLKRFLNSLLYKNHKLRLIHA